MDPSPTGNLCPADRNFSAMPTSAAGGGQRWRRMFAEGKRKRERAWLLCRAGTKAATARSQVDDAVCWTMLDH